MELCNQINMGAGVQRDDRLHDKSHAISVYFYHHATREFASTVALFLFLKTVGSNMQPQLPVGKLLESSGMLLLIADSCHTFTHSPISKQIAPKKR